jgi:hypothetical protein
MCTDLLEFWSNRSKNSPKKISTLTVYNKQKALLHGFGVGLFSILNILIIRFFTTKERKKGLRVN